MLIFIVSAIIASDCYDLTDNYKYATKDDIYSGLKNICDVGEEDKCTPNTHSSDLAKDVKVKSDEYGYKNYTGGGSTYTEICNIGCRAEVYYEYNSVVKSGTIKIKCLSLYFLQASTSSLRKVAQTFLSVLFEEAPQTGMSVPHFKIK